MGAQGEPERKCDGADDEIEQADKNILRAEVGIGVALVANGGVAADQVNS